MKMTTALLLLLSASISCLAQGPSDRQQFIRVEAPVVALTHVRVIDGTGAAPLDDQTIVIGDGCPGSSVAASLRQLDLNSDAVKETLVAKNVAITSTLP